MKPALVILAAGLATRYGGPKQLAPVGPGGEPLLDYAVYDGVRSGCDEVVLVIRSEMGETFRQHMAGIAGAALTVTLVAQVLDDLPPGAAMPARRTRPWGTGHAVLAVRHRVAGPFIVCNADDFYGRAAYEQLVEHLGDADPGRPEHAMVGYRVRETLSPFGGVSRAVCDVTPEGWLRGITEVLDLREQNGRLAGVTVAGDPFPVEPDAVVSTSLWGFTPAVLGPLWEQFRAFVDAHGADPESEFLLSTAIDEQIAAGRARVRVLLAPEARWCGVTFPEDRPAAARLVADLTARGVYPRDLERALARP